MLEIRWHGRAGQGAVTGAKGLADVVSTTGKQVQAFAFYGSAKRGAAMTAYNRVDETPIMNHEKYMEPDYVFVIDPALVYTTDVTINAKENTVFIITTHMNTAELVASQPRLEGKEVYTVDCIKIAQETIGRPIPNTPMLGAFMKISKMYDIEFFKESMHRILGKLPPKIVDANMLAIQRAYDEVK
ncbi:MAG: pyruvate flavodoxin oxidoreductase subunit gamma [Helicobacteraceae bacterium]|jgi:pyruvate ferredoxin oxidoreductase gamma subunit|nr:pyruvate flavodoxin oxidoreductase subunit gamma [Helicobacteraceae bacterium]